MINTYSNDCLHDLLAVLRGELPHSNAIYTRITAPQNQGRPYFVASSVLNDSFIALFADRSRLSESQCWIYHSLQNMDRVPDGEYTVNHRARVKCDLLAALRYIHAQGGLPELRIAMLHHRVHEGLEEYRSAMTYLSRWDQYLIDLSAIEGDINEDSTIVPEDQLDLVIRTSSIPRQKETLITLPSAALLDDNGKLLSWAYIGIDGSFATLYTLPDHRGKGLGSRIAKTLLTDLHTGKYAKIGFSGTGWVQADVAHDNEESARIMKRLGGETRWQTMYCRIDLDRVFPAEPDELQPQR